MIGYPISLEELERRIEAAQPGWLDRASTRVAKFKEKGGYDEPASIWSEIKPVYLALQGNAKCAFCERKLESQTFGLAEQDMEHFRPKKAVAAWVVPLELSREGIRCTPPTDSQAGYHLLAYHPFNYTAACKPCNSNLKKAFFPIAGIYDPLGENPRNLLATEKPFLIFPIGDFDADPEDLIEFQGIQACPKHIQGFERHRALVTIHLFALNETETRDNLALERARMLALLYPQLEKLADPNRASEHALAHKIVATAVSPKAPHTNCTRSFKRLFQQDPAMARQLFEAAADLVESKS